MRRIWQNAAQETIFNLMCELPKKFDISSWESSKAIGWLNFCGPHPYQVLFEGVSLNTK